MSTSTFEIDIDIDEGISRGAHRAVHGRGTVGAADSEIVYTHTEEAICIYLFLCVLCLESMDFYLSRV